jgi:hypothetical protein
MVDKTIQQFQVPSLAFTNVIALEIDPVGDVVVEMGGGTRLSDIFD